MRLHLDAWFRAVDTSSPVVPRAAETYPSNAFVHLARGHRLHWEETEHGYVLLYPEGMVTLDLWASEVLKRCDGSMTIDEIVKDIKIYYPRVDMAHDVLEFFLDANTAGWIATD